MYQSWMDFLPTSLICFLVLDTTMITFYFRSGSMIRSHNVHHHKFLQYFLLLPSLTGNTVTALLSTACCSISASCLSSIAALALEAEESTSSADKLSTTYQQFRKWFHILFFKS